MMGLLLLRVYEVKLGRKESCLTSMRTLVFGYQVPMVLVPFILPIVGLEGLVNTSHPRHGFLIATVIRNEMKTEELGSQGGR